MQTSGGFMSKVSVEYGKGIRLLSKMEGKNQEIVTDAPKSIGGKEEFVSPTDLLCMALGSCVLTMMGMIAEQSGIDLTGTRAEVQKTYNGAQIGSLHVEIFVERELDERAITRLEKAGKMCPVHNAIGSNVEHTITFHWKKASV